MYDAKIESLIRSLGIGATYRGFQYLIYGVKLCVSNEDYLLAVSKLLYPQIAKEFHATSSSVERNIRTVVNVCWNHGNRVFLQKIALHPLHDKPTAGEFFDILAGHLTREETGSSKKINMI